MPKELVHFQNFAKLKDTKIAFNDITVIAGKPGTGKSYVMKFMYAYNETENAIISGKYKMHYALMDGEDNTLSLLNLTKNTLNLTSSSKLDLINKLIEESKYIEALNELEQNKNLIYSELNENSKTLFDSLIALVKHFATKQKNAINYKEEDKFHFIFRNILESIFTNIDQISTNFSYSFNNSEIIYKNSELKLIKLNISKNYTNAIFVETPLIIEFEKYLPEERFKTPYHIDSLLQELNKTDYSFTSDETSDFINKFRKSANRILKGNITKGTKGFSFESNNGKTYDILNASSGIKSIGLLQYLVTNKALKKGSVLYWEEPEVHLHPSWQLKMVDLFVELMNAGVKIVFSTHSPFMADYLNAISKRNNYRDRISFNVLDEKDGVVTNHILNDDNWDILQKELMDAFEDILWQYL